MYSCSIWPFFRARLRRRGCFLVNSVVHGRIKRNTKVKLLVALFAGVLTLSGTIVHFVNTTIAADYKRTTFIDTKKLRCGTHKTFVELFDYPLVQGQCSRKKKPQGCTFSPQSKPSLLWTMPGAGSTWLRKILEEATGLPTGSIYNGSVHADIRCEGAVLCMAADPTIHTFGLVTWPHKSPPSSLLSFRNSVQGSKRDVNRLDGYLHPCHGHQEPSEEGPKEPLEFSRALIIDQDPVFMAFAEAQQRTLRQWDSSDYRVRMRQFQATPQTFYGTTIWKRVCRHFFRVVEEYVIAWHSYVSFWLHHGPNSVLIVKLENLLDRQKRETELERILEFLGAPLVVESLLCAFERTDDSDMLSQVNVTQFRGMKTNARTSQNSSLSDFLSSVYRGKKVFEWTWEILSPVGLASDYVDSSEYLRKIYSTNPTNRQISHPAMTNTLGFRLDKWYEEPLMLQAMNSMLSQKSRSSPPTTARQDSYMITDTPMQRCIEQAWHIQEHGRILLVFAGDTANVSLKSNESVLPQLLNVMAWLRRSRLRQVLVIAVDKRYEALLDSIGVATCFLEMPERYQVNKNAFVHELYETRLRTIETFLRTGLQVIHTDLDAVWNNDLTPFLDALHRKGSVIMPIVASRGTFPHIEARQWGGETLCMGLISLLPDEAVIQVFRSARMQAALAGGDDQIGLNRALRKMGLKWESSQQEAGFVDVLTKNGVKRTGVLLLPEEFVMRKCGEGKKGIVMHCFDRGVRGAGRQEKMDQRGLWIIRKDWQEVLTRHTGGDLLDAVSMPP